MTKFCILYRRRR